MRHMARTIDLSKRYRDILTGREVRIYAVDGCYPYAIHGARKDDRGWISGAWKLEQLEEMPVTHTRWLNVYEASAAGIHRTREDADIGSTPDRIACIQITYAEGEGLEQSTSAALKGVPDQEVK